MAANPAIVRTDGPTTWFRDTKYLIQDRIDEGLKDPIYDLFGEVTPPTRANQISITGRDNIRTGRTKAEGGQVAPQSPVEEDQKTQYYITFEASMVISYESMVHDQYKFAEEDPAELVDNVFRGISRLLHAQLFNGYSSTTVTLLGTAGSYDISMPNGKSVFSSTHSGPGYSSKSNLYSDAPLSIPNITAAGQHGIKNFVHSTGERMTNFQADLIIVPSQLEMVEAAVQHTRSEKVSGTANNAINYYKGMMDVAELRYAPESSADNSYSTTLQYHYIVANKALLKKSIGYTFAERPRVFTKFMDPDNGDSKITVLARVATVPKRWQFGVFVPATTAPTHPGQV